MREETRRIMVPKNIVVYVASDGKEFNDIAACERYEYKLGYTGIKVVNTAIKKFK